MKKIGVLSDTHGWLNPKVFEFFKDCDEIWHAGDIGSTDVAQLLSSFKRLRAVYGNIDGQEIRLSYPKTQIFNIEGLKVVMTHIGGYPNHYERGIKELLLLERPDIFISGHSHILKIMNDKELAQLIFAFRIFDPDLEITLSTREDKNFRDHMTTLGITSLSAGSKTDPGGYEVYKHELEQFVINDGRTPDEVLNAVESQGYEVVWKDWDLTLQ